MNTKQARVIDPVLTEAVMGYRHPDRVGHVLFPHVPVLARGGQIIEFGKESFLRYKTRRAPGTNTKRLQFGYRGQPFVLTQDALEGMVPIEHVEDAAQVPGLDLGKAAVTEVMDILSLGLEIEQAQLATDASKYSANNKVALAGSDRWSDPSSDPAQQVRQYGEAVRGRIGTRPNVLLVSASGFNALIDHPKIIERFKYTSSASITTEMLAQLFNVRRVAVGEAVYLEQNADDMQDVWGNSAVLAYVPEQVTSLRAPSFGYTYTLKDHPLAEESYFERNAKSWIYPVTYDRAPVLSGIDAGFLIQNLA
ncbi:major capsid protein [Pusillimonas noertemannii]|nr:major capsid protein [Pusillimonas noertemannii]